MNKKAVKPTTQEAPEKSPTREECLQAAQKLQEQYPNTVIARDFWREHGDYPERVIFKYWGRWKDFTEEAGLYTGKETPEEKLTDEDQNILFTEQYIYNPETDTYVTFLDRAGVRLSFSGDQHRNMLIAYSNWSGNRETINEICRTFGIRRDWFMEYKSVHGWTHDSDPFTNEEIMSRPTDEMVKDVLQMKRLTLYRETEKAKWADTQHNAKKWVNFEQNVLMTLGNHIDKNLPSYKPPMVNLKKQERFAVLLPPYDLHYGKYGWADETGQSYNRKEARELLIYHTNEILRQVAKFGRPERIICPSGSDWFHIDTPALTTTRGTPQDCDGTHAQILIEGTALAFDHVEMLRQVAPVEWLPVQGNHDRSLTMTLMLTLQARYANSKDVHVRVSPRLRQYCLYGNSLLGFAHGDTVKPADCHAVMTKEAPKLWAQAQHHYYCTGHLHHEVKREIHGITHIQLKSLSGADRFHSRGGWVTAGRGLHAFIVTEDRGITAELVSPIQGDTLFGVKIKQPKGGK